MDLSYPIGEFQAPASLGSEQIRGYIQILRDAPARFRDAVRGLSGQQLDTPYRPGGWTVRQVIHHVADSHMNAYIRFRLALSEDEPAIKPYDQTVWAEFADAKSGPVEISLALIEAMHARWVSLAESLPEMSFTRAFHHPERGRVTLDMNLAMYAWHCRHHAAHITGLRQRMNW